MCFNERLKKSRENKGLSQKQVSDILHISKTSICDYEHGVSTPGPDKLKDMANLYEVSTDYLLGTDFVYAQSDHDELLNKINRLNDDNKKIVQDIADKLLNYQKK